MAKPHGSRRIARLAAVLLGVAAVGLNVTPAAAAPFSPDPVSFAGYSNETFRRRGKDVFVRNLSLCGKEGQGGYRCLAGEAFVGVPGKGGRNFCRIDALWYVPFSRTVQIRTKACTFRSDRQRLIDQGQQLLRQGLDTLENYGR